MKTPKTPDDEVIDESVTEKNKRRLDEGVGGAEDRGGPANPAALEIRNLGQDPHAEQVLEYAGNMYEERADQGQEKGNTGDVSLSVDADVLLSQRLEARRVTSTSYDLKRKNTKR